MLHLGWVISREVMSSEFRGDYNADYRDGNCGDESSGERMERQVILSPRPHGHPQSPL